MEARKQFWTLKEDDNYDWERMFTKARVSIDYEVNIESYGAKGIKRRVR
ncbi:hypothetical protein ACFPES_14300 [Paenibacillus sp. GCM10023248]|nr:hypothetical protein [Paenibacillus sp. MAHUQ-63]